MQGCERGIYMKKRFTVTLLLITLCIFFVSCGENGKKERSVKNLSDALRTSYEAELSFCVRQGGEALEGDAMLLRDGANVRLDILSPEPVSGLSIEYDAAGAPSTVAVHFKGIDTTLPTAAISRINVLAALAAGDFPEILARVSGENITEYEYGESLRGYCAKLKYGEADVVICYSEDGSSPYSIEYSDGELYGTFTYAKFKLDINENQD